MSRLQIACEIASASGMLLISLSRLAEFADRGIQLRQASKPRYPDPSTAMAGRFTKARRLRAARRPPLEVAEILGWADAHYDRTGKWPTHLSGYISGTLDEKWCNVDTCLRQGLRELRPGSSIARLLAEHRGHRNLCALPPLVIEDILRWADAHHDRVGSWPHVESGPIVDAPGETWCAADAALFAGKRGLPGGSSLARLLEEQRGVRNTANLPSLTVEQILLWADAHHERTGEWPKRNSGAIPEAEGETWKGVFFALWTGYRGIQKRTTLAEVLAQYRGVRNELTLRRILQWADAHNKRTGTWPKQNSGPVHDAPDETWGAISAALHHGWRGLAPGSSLAGLLADHRKVRKKRGAPKLRPRQIVEWAEAYWRCTGQWPKVTSGPVKEAPGETWRAIDSALRVGFRGLPGGSSLHRLLVGR
jgi:hypothetical protein